MSGFKIPLVLERPTEYCKHSSISLGSCKPEKCCILLRPPLEQDIPVLSTLVQQTKRISFVLLNATASGIICNARGLPWSTRIRLKTCPGNGFIISAVSRTRLHTSGIHGKLIRWQMGKVVVVVQILRKKTEWRNFLSLLIIKLYWWWFSFTSNVSFEYPGDSTSRISFFNKPVAALGLWGVC